MREIREKAKRVNKIVEGLRRRCDNLLPEDKSKLTKLLDNAATQLAQAETYKDYYQFLFVPEHIEPELRIAEQRRDERIRLDEEQVDELTQKIAIQNDEIASGWKVVGIGLAVLVGAYLLAEVCASFCNQHLDPPHSVTSALGGILLAILGAIGCLGVIVFGLVFWLGIVVVIAMVFWQIVSRP